MISGEPDAVVAAFDRTKAGIVDEVPFIDGRLSFHKPNDSRWAVVAYAAPDPIAKKRLVMVKTGCIVINGALLDFDGHRGDAAIQAVAEALEKEPIEHVYERMTGSYAIGGYIRRHGLFGFSDFSGVTPAYTASSDGLTIVGNKPSIVALGLPTARIDTNALSWLVGHANIFGPATPIRGVDQIVPESLIRARNGQRAEKLALPRIWPDRGADLVADLTAAEWDEITHELVENTRSCLSYFPQARVALTGGKDSRLVLALTCAVRKRNEIEVFTNGHSDNPDVETAAYIASQMGIEHRVSAPGQAAKPDYVRTWDMLVAQNGRFDGIICPWDGRSFDIQGTKLEFTGFGGELYRGSHAKQFVKNPPLSIEGAKLAWRNYHQPFDPLKILRGSYASYQHEWTNNWVETDPSHISVLPEKFYVNNRLGYSSGPLMQNVPGRIKLAPLLSRRAAKLFFRLGRHARVSEVLIYEVMRRTAPELVKIPFMKQLWSAEVLKRGPDLPTESFKTSQAPTSQSVAPAQFGFIADQTAAIGAFLRDAASKTALDQIIDVERTIKCAHDPELMKVTVNAKGVYSALSIAHTLTGKRRPARDKVMAA